MNTLKTTFFLTCLTTLLVAMGSAIGGQSGMIIAFGIAGGMNVFSYWYSEKIVLKMYKAKGVSESESPSFYSMVSRLARKANLSISPWKSALPDSNSWPRDNVKSYWTLQF